MTILETRLFLILVCPYLKMVIVLACFKFYKQSQSGHYFIPISNLLQASSHYAVQ